MGSFCQNWLKESIFESSSDEEVEEMIMIATEQENLAMRRALASRTPRNYIDRGFMEGHERLFNDYFSENPVYPPDRFRRRFRMRRELFVRIQSEIEAHEPYFQQKMNAEGRLGLSSLQKITDAFRMLAYGVSADLLDEYVRIGKSTALLSMKKFVKAVISVFGKEYLRTPNSEDIARLMAIGESQGFLGMLGSIDCLHWKWKNCPTAWKGAHNDLNVLDRSFVFRELAEGLSPKVNYKVNGNQYSMGYYLADGIYPSWATFVKTIPVALSNKAKHFKMMQEACRKDVERAFGVLQARFAIVRGPARYFKRSTLTNIMLACIILPNMIVEDERHLHVQPDVAHIYDQVEDGPPSPVMEHLNGNQFRDFVDQHIRIRDREVHSQLQNDLIEHLWNIYSNKI